MKLTGNFDALLGKLETQVNKLENHQGGSQLAQVDSVLHNLQSSVEILLKRAALLDDNEEDDHEAEEHKTESNTNKEKETETETQERVVTKEDVVATEH